VQLAIPQGAEARAREFYVAALGCDEIEKPGDLKGRGGLWLRSGSVDIHMGIDADFRPARKAHPAFECSDYPDLVEALRLQGIAVTEYGTLADGRPHCYVADPFGNRIELIGQRS